MDGDTPLDGNPFRPKNPFRPTGNPFRNPAAALPSVATAPTDTAPVGQTPGLAASLFSTPTLPPPVGPSGQPLPSLGPSAATLQGLQNQKALDIGAGLTDPTGVGRFVTGVGRGIGTALATGIPALGQKATQVADAADVLAARALGRPDIAAHIIGRNLRGEPQAPFQAAAQRGAQAVQARLPVSGLPGQAGQFVGGQVVPAAVFTAALPEGFASLPYAARIAASGTAGAVAGGVTNPLSPTAPFTGAALGVAGEAAIGAPGALLDRLGRLRAEAGPPAPLNTPDYGTDNAAQPLTGLPSPTLGQRVGALRDKLAEAISTPERRAALTVDPVTQVQNATAYARALPRVEADPTVGVVTGDAINLKARNDLPRDAATPASHSVGDAYLASNAAAAVQAVHDVLGVTPEDAARYVYRPHGDEFAILGVPRDQMEAVAARWRQLAGTPDHAGYPGGVRTGTGLTAADADAAMQAAGAAETFPKFRPQQAAAPAPQAPAQALAAPPPPPVADGGFARPIPLTDADAAMLSPEELHHRAQQWIDDDANAIHDVFGGEAERYNRLQRAANSALDPVKADAAADAMQAMEAKLTPAQRDRLYGVGLPATGIYDPDELRLLQRKSQEYAPANLADSPDGLLLNNVARELTTRTPLGKPVSNLILARSVRELQRRGYDLETAIPAAIRARAGLTGENTHDLIQLLHDRLGELRRPSRGIGSEGGPPAPPANPEAGGIVKPLLGGLAGGGVGVAAGYATGQTDEERVRNAILGGLAGAGGGLLAGRALERGATPPEPVEPSLTQRLAAETEARPTRTPSAEPIGAQGPLRKPEANLIRTIPGLSPDAQARLQSIAAQLPAPGRESFSTITRAAEQSGLTAAEINALPANHIDRVTALAAKMLSAQGEERYSRILALQSDPTIGAAQRASLEAERLQIGKDNLALYRQWQRSGTETARDLAARAAMVKALPPDANAWIASTEDFAGRQLGDAEQAEIRAAFDRHDVPWLLKKQASLKPSSATEKALTIWKGGLLGPGGIPGAALGAAAGAAYPADDNGQRVMNTLKGAAIGSVSGAILAKATGDLTWAAFRDLSRVPAGMADYLSSLVDKQRVTATEMPFFRRVGSAWRHRGEFGKALRGEPTAEEIASMTPPRQTNFDTPLFQAWFNGPFRLLKGVSEVAYKAAVDVSLRNQAKALALQAGKRGADFAPEVERLLANPTPEMQARAIADGAYDTMTNRTAAGNALSALAKVGGPAGQVVIPFTKTPGSIATKFLADAGPVGFARGAYQLQSAVRDAIDELAKNGAVSDATRLKKATAVNLIGQGVVGTAPILAGYLMYRAGRASGMSANVNPALKNTRRAAQIPNDAFLIGGRWVQPDRIGVPGMLYSMGAAIGQMQDIGAAKGWGAVGSGLAAAGRIVTDQPFVTGPNQAQEALQNPASFGTRYVQSLAGSVVPAAIRNTSRALDTEERDADTPLEAIQANTPFRSGLPVRRDALGQPIPILPSGLQQAGSPLKVTANVIPSDPVMQELVRLNVPIGVVKRLPGESAKDYGDRQEQIGNDARAALEHTMASPAYLAGDDGVQAAMLQKALEDVHRRAALGTGPNPFTRRQSRLDRLRAAAVAPTNPFLTAGP